MTFRFVFIYHNGIWCLSSHINNAEWDKKKYSNLMALVAIVDYGM